MKNVLYIGNNLNSKNSNISGIQTLGSLLEKEGYNMYYASSKTNIILRLLDMFWSVVKLQKKVDIVLLDTYSTTNFYYALIISRLCQILSLKYISILHGGNLENRLKKNPKLSGLIFKNAHKLVAPSNFFQTVFETYGYNDVIFIPNSIEIDNYSFHNRPIDRIKLLWVRSFASIYNPELAILVLEKLKERNYDAELTMVGPDSDGSLIKVKTLAESKQLKIHFTGKLAKSEWLELSKNSNVFINTTNLDNTPLSVIEAMALGLPVVSTNVGGLPYLISDHSDGLLVEPKNVNAMVDAIIELNSDENLRSKLVNNARSKVENYDWNIVKHKWETLLS
ncbi:glycosyltransferase family 4 protein [Winogradskyella forsetii]|uniref:glycosyltransferase family 4 protein n=1 Tax=Winogradskyella forsetii TaxID=2686077 RepID=UPI0015C12C33|nr:glycosyltransferase family 4 protein [Winogradskyella forsetii]